MSFIPPSELIRRARTNRIGSTLQAEGSIPDVGMFGAPGSLPTDPGPPEPPILNGTLLPDNSGGGGGGPDVQVNWTGQGSAPYWNQPPTQGPPSYGPFPGTNGPQGTIYGYDPNTGQPIFNATGSPKPGFFDSTAGKIAEQGAAAGLNIFVPGLGFISKAIFDAMRNRANAKNTGTDLTGRQNQAAPKAPSGPAWYQPGYQQPTGIQNAIARGDYERAYGPSQQSLSDLFIMDQQRFGGNPNSMPNAANEGRTLFDDQGNPTQQGPMYPTVNPALTAHLRQGGPALRAGNAASADAYNAWAMSQRKG